MTPCNRMCKVALAAAALSWGAALAWAQEETAPADQPAPETSIEIEEPSPPSPPSSAVPVESPPAAATVTASTSAPGMISVDFKDADIRQVLRIISLKSGVDIVAGADVEGLVTIKLTDVPWEEALDIILRTYGFTYERKGNIVRVLTKESLESEVLATEVFPLNYAKAKDVPTVIQEMVSDRGKVRFDERTNTVIVTDIPSSLYQIKEVIARIDQRTPQVLVEAKIVDTQLTKEENLGIEWNQALALTQTLPTFQSTFPFPTGTDFGKIGKTFSFSRFAEDVQRPTVTVGTLTAGSLSATLNFLRNRTETNIVSNPSIAIINNQKASIHIGQEYPVPNYSIDPTTGNIQINGYETKKTGTLLEVTPHVNTAKEIVVDLKPEVIAVGDAVEYTAGDNTLTLPLFTTQTAETTVRISNGETIAIGGLVKTSDSHVQKTVPFLGEIPIIGLFFRNNRWYSGGSSPNRQDLLIFLTVTLMEDAAPVTPAQSTTIMPAPPGASPYGSQTPTTTPAPATTPAPSSS